MSTSEKNLRDALKANAAFSIASGMILLVFAGKLGQLMNITQVYILQLVGMSLLLFVAILLYNAFKKKLDIRQVKFIIIQDWAWVIGSMLLLLMDPFDISLLGNTLIAGVAIVVMLLAIFQMLALRKTLN